jgi:hypothetical protein
VNANGIRPDPPSVALRREDAAAALGVSTEIFDKHVRPTLPCVRLGSLRLYPVAALQEWVLEHAEAPTDELERLR